MQTASLRVFISYSHDSQEHADRVLALADRLRADGIDTVLDRYEPSPPEGWTRWMVRQIESADLVLMVFTDTYQRRLSGKEEEGRGLGVRWEGHLIYQELYEAGTINHRFIPVVLAESARGTIPTLLRAWPLYCLDSQDGYERLYRRITGQDGVERPPLGRVKQLPQLAPAWRDTPPASLIAVPRLPAHYVERRQHLEDLERLVLGNTGARCAITSAGAQVALQGMGGIGKSVLAAALCHSAAVRARFVDGIVWLRLGQTPNMERRQLDLHGCFEPAPARFEDLESGRIALSKLLADRAALVVLDDVWSVEHARAFDVVGPNGALLVTTRNSALVRRLGMEHLGVNLLHPQEARHLLARTSGRQVETLGPEAALVIEECGYLPLAIAMIGGMVQGVDNPWTGVLQRLAMRDLGRIAEEFGEYQHPTLLRALQVSVDALGKHERDRYLQLAVFPEDTHLPEAAIVTLWGDDVRDELETPLLLREFVDRALLFRDERQHYFLHDLQRSYLLAEAGVEAAVHRRLVENYRKKTGSNWSKGPEDGYFGSFIVHHLCRACLIEEAVDTAIEFKWMERQLSHGGITRVLNDLKSLADSPLDQPTRDLVTTIEQAVRLSAHRLESDTKSLSAQLLARLDPSAHPSIAAIRSAAARESNGMWLEPAFASLERPGSALERTISQPAAPNGAIYLDSRRILCCVKNSLKIHDADSGLLLKEFSDARDEVTALAMTSDGAYFAAACKDGGIRIWSSSDEELVCEMVVPPLPTSNVPYLRVEDLKTASRGGAVDGATDDTLAPPMRFEGGQPRPPYAVFPARNHEDAAAPPYRRVAEEPSSVRAIPDWPSKLFELFAANAASQRIRADDVAPTIDNPAEASDAVARADSAWAEKQDSWSLDSRSQLSSLFERSLASEQGAQDAAVRIEGPGEAADDIEDVYVTCMAAVPGSHKLVAGTGSRSRSRWFSNQTQYAVWLLDCDTGTSEYIDAGHVADVTTVMATNAGDKVVSGAEDGTIRISDIVTRSVELVFPTVPWSHRGKYVGALAVTPDRKRIVSVSRSSGPIQLWDFETGLPCGEMGDGSDFSVAFALSPDGASLYAGGYGRFIEAMSGGRMIEHEHIRIWDLNTTTLRAEMRGHHDPVTSLSLSPDNRRLVSTSWDRTVRVWDLARVAEPEPPRPRRLPGKVSEVHLHPSGSLFAASSGSTVTTFEVATGRHVRTYQCPDEVELESFAITPDGRGILLAGRMKADIDGKTDSCVWEFDIDTGVPVREFQRTLTVDTEAAFLAGLQSAAEVAVASSYYYGPIEDDAGEINHAITVWSLNTGRIMRLLPIGTPRHGKPFAERHPSALSRDGRYFAFATVEDEFRICDLQEDYRVMPIGEHNGWIGGVGLLPQEGLMVSAGGNDEAIRFWSLKNGELVREWAQQGRSTAVAVSPSEKYIVVGNEASEVRVYSVAEGRVMACMTLDAPVQALATHVSLPILAAGDELGGVHAFSVRNCPDWS